jgi:tetratricopeptide (TPR) repeat protein
VRRIALLLLLLVPVNADQDTALFFLKKAQDATAREDYDKAEHWCRRALEEEKDFAPALLALANVAQARGDRAQALKHLEACIARDDESLSDAESQAVRKARLKLKQLDGARFEFERLADGYVRKVLALARREAKKKPQLARECWRNVLLVDPTNAEAAGKLGSADVAPQEGTALFNGRDLAGWSAKEPAWTVKNGILASRQEDTASVTRHKQEIRGKYSLVCELRVVEDAGKGPFVGILFGLHSKYDHFGLWIWPDSWQLEHMTGENEYSELATRRFRTFKGKYSRFDWNTYRIDVDGKRVTGYVNGTKIWSTSGAIRELEGFAGFLVQEQAVEIRKFQLIQR